MSNIAIAAKPGTVREVLNGLRNGCYELYMEAIGEVQDVLLFDNVKNLNEEQLTGLLHSLSMIRTDLRALAKADV